MEPLFREGQGAGKALEKRVSDDLYAGVYLLLDRAPELSLKLSGTIVVSSSLIVRAIPSLGSATWYQVLVQVPFGRSIED